ncbi:hypothetical protein FHX53_001742 [Yonghaparkia alkaliphila]|uniref:Uncharacterized protein n=1 Tax=Microcella alkalica TaxID=355930 RepID=A0A839EAE6_9MICO|nr:hypothetical protein [Microcella alkalica]MBA8848143.1 hypothetical protein [Microcella alkalica]
MTTDARLSRGVGEQFRPVAVDVDLALGRSARAEAGGEHDGIAAGQHLGEFNVVALLEVHDERSGSGGCDVGLVVGVADQRDGFMRAVGEQSRELAGDLAVRTSASRSTPPATRCPGASRGRSRPTGRL